MSPFSPKIIPQNTWLRTVHPLNSKIPKKQQIKLDENLSHQPGHGHPTRGPGGPHLRQANQPHLARLGGSGVLSQALASAHVVVRHRLCGATADRGKTADFFWENVEKSWKNQSLFGGKYGKPKPWQNQLSDFSWEIWSEKKSRRQNFWEKLSGDIRKWWMH
jgi:hypothetical protein